jgi:hypothetical protein
MSSLSSEFENARRYLDRTLQELQKTKADLDREQEDRKFSQILYASAMDRLYQYELEHSMLYNFDSIDILYCFVDINLSSGHQRNKRSIRNVLRGD